MSAADLDRVWAGERPRLLGLAYRLTGSRSEAEDLVQEAFARLAVAKGVEDPPAWLTTVTSRLAVDHLRLARVQREQYIGPWVPEPVEDTFDDPADNAVMAESVSTALLVVMESLSPVERAAFVLHDVFGYGHDEVAVMLDRSPASVRQAAVRGRRHVHDRRPRFEPDADTRRAVGDRFLAAAQGADLDLLLSVLSPEVVFRSDGGGVVTAARQVLHGRDRVAQFLAGLVRTAQPGTRITRLWVNQSPAMRVEGADGTLLAVMILHVSDDGQIAEINTVLNPAKLAAL